MRRRIVVGLALAVAVAGGVAAYLFLRGLEMPEAPLDAVPKGAYAVVYVDVPAVLDSSWYADYARPSAVGRAIAQLRARCGLDPLGGVSTLMLFTTSPTPERVTQVAAVATGDFDHAGIARCLEQRLAGSDHGVKRAEIDGMPAVIGFDVPGSLGGSSNLTAAAPLAAAFVGRHGAAAGTVDTVRAVIRTVRGEAQSAATDPTLGPLFGWAQPDAQCSHTLGLDTRSNGRARNR